MPVSDATSIRSIRPLKCESAFSLQSVAIDRILSQNRKVSVRAYIRRVISVVRKFAKSRFSAIILNLLLPGLGHIYWRETGFGIFVFLIMLTASMLFFVTFFISLPAYAIILMTALPAIFYFFTFVDLVRVVKAKSSSVKQNSRRIILFLIIGVVYQLLVPLAPGNFGIRNRPVLFTLQTNDFSPLFRKGELLKASRLAYVVDIFFLKKPVLHALPRRYDVVRYSDSTGVRTGIVIGLPGEQIEIAEGVVVVNGFPDIHRPAGNLELLGEWPETSAQTYSVLAATLQMGRIVNVQDVPMSAVIGRVEEPL